MLKGGKLIQNMFPIRRDIFMKTGYRMRGKREREEREGWRGREKGKGKGKMRMRRRQ